MAKKAVFNRVAFYRKAVEVIVTITSFAAPVIFTVKGADFSYLPKQLFIYCGICLIIFLFICGTINKQKLRFNNLVFVLFSFLIWCLASVFYAYNFYEAFPIWVYWMALGVLLITLLQLDSKTLIVNLMLALILSATVNSLIGIAQYYDYLQWIPHKTPTSATFGNKNIASQFVVMIIPIAVAMMFLSKSLLRFLLLMLASISMSFFLIIAESRSAWLANMVSLTTLFIGIIILYYRELPDLLRNNRQRILIIVTVLPITWLTLLPSGDFFKDRFIINISSIEQYSSERHRVDIWKNTIAMIEDKPFIGYGLGNHQLFYPKYHDAVVVDQRIGERSKLRYVHNDWLQLLSETGLIGLSLLLALILVIVKLTRNSYVFQTSRQNKIYVISISAGLLALSVTTLFSFPMYRSIPPFVAIIYLAMLSNLGSQFTFVTVPKYVVRLVFLIPATLLLVYLIIIMFPKFMTNYDYNISKEAHRQGYNQIALNTSKKVYEKNPYNKKVLLQYGSSLLNLKKYNDSIEVLKLYNSYYPYSFAGLFNLGLSYLRNGDYQQARVSFQNLLDIYPRNAQAYQKLGKVDVFEKQYQAAEQAYLKSLEYDANNAEVYNDLAFIYLQQSQLSKVIYSLEKMIELDPNRKDKGKVEKAINQLKLELNKGSK